VCVCVCACVRACVYALATAPVHTMSAFSPIHLQRFSFRSLTDLVRSIPSLVVFYDTGAFHPPLFSRQFPASSPQPLPPQPSGRSNNVVCPGPPSKLQDMRCCVLQAALEYGSSGVSYDVLSRRLEEMGVDVRGQVYAFTNLAALLACMPGLRCIAPRT